MQASETPTYTTQSVNALVIVVKA